jgi:oligopeptide/dipeptide ABC transporter, ATP-binding protein, C-terminal domain
MEDVLLKVRNLKTYFYTEEGMVPAVDGLDFDLKRNETLAIVGESGCGKSVTSLSILGLVATPPGKIEDGTIEYEGTDLLKLSEKEMRKIRGNKISMIFQEPLTSLNPVFTVSQQMCDILRLHQGLKKNEARAKALEMLNKVKIPSAEAVLDEYPHQLSGGMRQRVMIAMALSCNPGILIADEPTTALDVTIQAQIMRLLNELQRDNETSIILITHDMGVVAQTATRVMVMYAGKAVECADVKDIFASPLHPYTLGLLKSIPLPTDKKDELYSIKGNIPSPKDYPAGCRFSSRCEKCCERCIDTEPPLFEMKDGRKVRCWLYEKEGR